MAAKKVINTVSFCRLKLSAQALYFHLLNRANDDGYVESNIVNQVCKLIGAKNTDVSDITNIGFATPEDDGVYVRKYVIDGGMKIAEH